MTVYIAASISEYTHKEGFISSILNHLVKTGKAEYGLINQDDNSGKIYILYYVLNGNPYLIYSAEISVEVFKELKRLHLEVLETIMDTKLGSLTDRLDTGIHHKNFNENFYKKFRNPSKIPVNLDSQIILN